MILAFALGAAFGASAVALAPRWMPAVLGVAGAGKTKTVALAQAARATLYGGATKSANVAKFFGGLLGFAARNPVLTLSLLLILSLLVFGLPFGLGKSRGELRLEAELARAQAHIHEVENQRDARIAELGQSVALLRQENSMLAQRGRDAIAAATPENEVPIAPELVAAWRGAISSLRARSASDSALNNSSQSSA